MTIEKKLSSAENKFNEKSDKILHLLWRNLVVVSPHVDLLISVDTGEDEEDSRTPGTANKQSSQSEDNGPLILLEISRPSEEL